MATIVQDTVAESCSTAEPTNGEIRKEYPDHFRIWRRISVFRPSSFPRRSLPMTPWMTWGTAMGLVSTVEGLMVLHIILGISNCVCVGRY